MAELECWFCDGCKMLVGKPKLVGSGKPNPNSSLVEVDEDDDSTELELELEIAVGRKAVEVFIPQGADLELMIA